MNGPREVSYFTDRDLGRKLPETLKASGLVVEAHDDHFGPLTPDEEWLAEVAKRGWLAITRDARIRYSPLALRVLMQTGARLFGSRESHHGGVCRADCPKAETDRVIRGQ